MAEDYYERLGSILKDRLNSDEDPFASWDPHDGRGRKAGNRTERRPPPRTAKKPELIAVPAELSADYAVLGLPPGSSLAECKSAWKKLMMKCHPDRIEGDQERKNEAARRAAGITEAWRRISRWFDTGIVS
ncbi:MAG: J domain-containing protein [Spirochaetales bacterium]|nr:J domain-containing protein [Spirochaetales bacterium]HPO02408.1 J domain-containing protein [Treponemataceae bacterium]